MPCNQEAGYDVDDLLATGGNRVLRLLVQQIDCELVGFGFIIEQGFTRA